jgi:hypothetical protein
MLLQRHDDSSQGFDIDGPTHQYAVPSAERDLERRNAAACLDLKELDRCHLELLLLAPRLLLRA